MTTNQNSISEQEWFKLSPVGLMALNCQGNICGVNPALEAVTGLSAAHFLGYNQETLPSAVHAPLLDDANLVHLQISGVDCWLQREARELEEGITLLYFQDVTEVYHLRQKNADLMTQMEELAITDTLTGLTNRRAFTQMLDAQVTRSRRYQNPLSLTLVEIIPPTSEAISDELVLTVSNYLRDRLRWADVLGRWDNNRFMLMLPETSEEAARTLIENISNGVMDLATTGGLQAPGFHLQFGMVEWGKGLDTARLIRQVEQALDAVEVSMVS